MKTRDKILAASLVMFNDEGEQNVTTVDIAAEMDISPGNLYYHFKGKNAIIIELYERFEMEMIDILNAPLENVSTDDAWVYMYVVFEHIYAFRFFYQNQHDIMIRVPEITRRFQRLLNRQFKTMIGFLSTLRDAEAIDINDQSIGQLSENIVLLQTHWLNYVALRDASLSEEVMFHRGVYQCLFLITPYLTEANKHLASTFQEVYLSKVESS